MIDSFMRLLSLGVKGDQQLLAAVKSIIVNKWTPLLAAVNSYYSQHEQASSVHLSFPIGELLTLLLSFITLTLKAAAAAAAATVAAKAPAAEAAKGSSSSTSCIHTMLMQQLMQILGTVVQFSLEFGRIEAVGAVWSQIGSRTAALLEAALRWLGRQKSSAVIDVVGMRAVIMDATMKLLDSGGWPGILVQVALQHVRRDWQTTAATAAVSCHSSNAEQQVLHGSSGDSPSLEGFIGNAGTAAVTGSSPDSQFRPVRFCQAEPTALELRAISMMHSCCKLLMHCDKNSQVGDEFKQTANNIRAAYCVLSSAATGVSEHVDWLKAHKQLAAPVNASLQCWLSLLGKSFVAVGRQLQLQQKWFDLVEGRQQELHALQNQLQGVQQSLLDIVQQKLALCNNTQMQEATALAQKCEQKLQVAMLIRAPRQEIRLCEAELHRLNLQRQEARKLLQQSPEYIQLCQAEAAMVQQQQALQAKVKDMKVLLQCAGSLQTLDPRSISRSVSAITEELVELIVAGCLL